MIKFAKISDAALGRVDIALTDDAAAAASMGFEPMDVVEAAGEWFLAERAQGQEFEAYVSERSSAARVLEIKAELLRLDNSSIRALRGVLSRLDTASAPVLQVSDSGSGSGSDFAGGEDLSRLVQNELRASALRAELAGL